MIIALSGFGLATCLALRWIYWDCLKFPIGLGGSLFYLWAAPRLLWVTALYGTIAWLVMRFSKVDTKTKHWLLAFGIGATILVLVLAIIFPCEKAPFFMGGYLLGILMHS